MTTAIENRLGTVSALTTTGYDVSGLDLESAMIVVQTQRANLLETQLKDQVSEIQTRQNQATLMNGVLAKLREMQGKFGSEAKNSDPIPDNALQTECQTLAAAAGMSANFSNKGELDKLVENYKSNMDSLTSSLQMQMLRLQSTNNKRNEAFDVMTNVTNKFNQSRSTIVGNMR